MNNELNKNPKSKTIDNDESENNSGELEEETSSEDSKVSFTSLLAGLSLEFKEKSKNEIKEKNVNDKEGNNNDEKEELNDKNIPYSNFIIKEIENDGNCFYRSISYYYRNREDDHAEFRELITSYIINNPDDYVFAVADEDVNIEGVLDQEIIYEKKKEYIINFARIASKDKEWAGNIEIATACILLNCNINMYTLNETGYSLFLQYNSERGEQQENIENINILYIDENHFNLLIPNLENDRKKDDLIRNNININNFKSIILEEKSKSNRKLMKNLKINSQKNNYNEIYTYILDNKKMPQRLQYTKEKSRKTMEKKRGKFKKLVREKYRIINNRLQYKHYYKNNFIWLNIIFQLEKIPLLNYVHFKFNHIKRETMEEKIIQLGFYWHGYSNDVIDL